MVSELVGKKQKRPMRGVFINLMAGGRLTDHRPQPAWILNFLIHKNQSTPKNTPMGNFSTIPTGRAAVSAKQAAKVFFNVSLRLE
jgi:hypothetical protein